MLEVDFRDDVIAASTLTGSKVFFANIPESVEKPYIAIFRVSGPRGYTLDGHDGTSNTRMQVDIYADDYPTAKTEASKVYDVQDTNSFKAVEIINEFDEYDDTLGTYRVSIDFLIYEEE